MVQQDGRCQEIVTCRRGTLSAVWSSPRLFLSTNTSINITFRKIKQFNLVKFTKIPQNGIQERINLAYFQVGVREFLNIYWPPPQRYWLMSWPCNQGLPGWNPARRSGIVFMDHFYSDKSINIVTPVQEFSINIPLGQRTDLNYNDLIKKNFQTIFRAHCF